MNKKSGISEKRRKQRTEKELARTRDPHRLVVLDEGDYLSPKAQAALREIFRRITKDS